MDGNIRNIQDMLEVERKRLLDEQKQLQSTGLPSGERREGSPYGKREEEATESFELEKRLALERQLEEQLADIENALAKIAAGENTARQIASAMGMYYGGMSLDAIQQQFKQDYDADMSESNYWNWVKRFTKEAEKQSKDFKPEVGDEWVADETYMKLGERTVYFLDIIDAKTRFLLASHVSFNRGAREARMLMKLAEERAGKTPKIVITDKLRSYISGIEDAYGSDTKHVQGGPFHLSETGESTAEIERFHKTLEQRTKVFEKFKDIASIKLLTDGWLINYNFFKQNEGCGNIPPAQAMSKVVPFKDWNDIVRSDKLPDIDYRVKLHRRQSVNKGVVLDATLTPIVPS